MIKIFESKFIKSVTVVASGLYNNISYSLLKTNSDFILVKINFNNNVVNEEILNNVKPAKNDMANIINNKLYIYNNNYVCKKTLLDSYVNSSQSNFLLKGEKENVKQKNVKNNNNVYDLNLENGEEEFRQKCGILSIIILNNIVYYITICDEMNDSKYNIINFETDKVYYKIYLNDDSTYITRNEIHVPFSKINDILYYDNILILTNEVNVEDGKSDKTYTYMKINLTNLDNVWYKTKLIINKNINVLSNDEVLYDNKIVYFYMYDEAKEINIPYKINSIQSFEYKNKMYYVLSTIDNNNDEPKSHIANNLVILTE